MIKTLVKDIYGLFDGQSIDFDTASKEIFGASLASKVSSYIHQDSSERSGLRMSNLGTVCERKLWYQVNQPDKALPLEAYVKIKFLYGHLLEDLLLYLAKEAGHDVTGEQTELSLFGIIGHRDALIDGVLIDSKSASSYSFRNFEAGLRTPEDKFGYLTQLDLYIHASPEQPTRGGFLVIDKTLGKICLDLHEKSGIDYETFVAKKIEMVSSRLPPEKHYEAEPYGKSGNMGLGIGCSYCDFRNHCWPGLRTFLYSSGPVFLTRVVKTPDVPEV